MHNNDSDDNTRLAFVCFVVALLLLFVFVALKPIEKYRQQRTKTPIAATPEASPLPPVLVAPHLTKPKISTTDDKALGQIISWSAVNGAEAYVIEIWIDEQLEQRVTVKATRDTQFEWIETYPGTYYYKISAVDQYQRNGLKSKKGEFEIIALMQETPDYIQEFTRSIAAVEPETAVSEALQQIQVNRPPEVPPELIAKQRKIRAEQERIRREIASKELKIDSTILAQVSEALDEELESKLQYKPVVADYLDPFYNHNVQLKVGSFGIISSTRSAGYTDSIPLATTATVKAHYQDESEHSYEAALTMKTMALNEEANSISPTIFEAYYSRRWISPVTWVNWSSLSRKNVSLVAGLELYRNSQDGVQNYLEEYNLLKLGGRLRFTLYDNWETGGDLIYGFALDQETQKLEVQGYLDYLVKGTYLLGVGYRAHLLESRSSDITPYGIAPYKEAYAEAYGSLKYQF